MVKTSSEEEIIVSSPNVLCDEETREIYLVGTIEDSMFQSAIIALRRLDRTRGNITIILNTPGGEISAGLAIYDAINMCKNKVICHCFGQCMSMGVAVLMACDTRLSSPECRFMVHDCTSSFGEMATLKMALYFNEHSFLKDRYCKILADNSELSLGGGKKKKNKATIKSIKKMVG
jgi:ATP-dependent Clp endopeptidase proteolytic subunit ClpP